MNQLSENEVEKLFRQDTPKGIVLEVKSDGYVIKDVSTQEILLITQGDFDYDFACQLLKMANENESVWIIGYDPVTRVQQEI